jgi:hypothetical protein
MITAFIDVLNYPDWLLLHCHKNNNNVRRHVNDSDRIYPKRFFDEKQVAKSFSGSAWPHYHSGHRSF